MKRYILSFQDTDVGSGVMVHVCNPSTQEAKTGGTRVQDHSEALLEKFLFTNESIQCFGFASK
jgi:hypothetical protein